MKKKREYHMTLKIGTPRIKKYFTDKSITIQLLQHKNLGWLCKFYYKFCFYPKEKCILCTNRYYQGRGAIVNLETETLGQDYFKHEKKVKYKNYRKKFNVYNDSIDFEFRP